MSRTASPPDDDRTETTDQNWVEEHREQIEREANSDAPDAWVFERLLQSAGGVAA
jgi:hypothetical protein